MHILYLHQYYCPPGGSGNNRSYELARHWKDAGHSVTIVTTPAYFPEATKQSYLEADVPTFEVHEGIKVVVLRVDYSHHFNFRKRVASFIQFYRRLLRVQKQLQKPDIIYASSTPPSVGEAGMKMAARWEIPFVFETVDVWPDVPEGMGILSNKLLLHSLHRRVNRIYKEAAHIVCLSPGMKEQILSHGVPDSKITVSLNGTNPAKLKAVERTDRKPVTVLYAGTIGIANGLDQLVDAAKKFDSNGSAVKFLVVGSGNDKERVVEYATAQQVSNIEFRDKVPKDEIGKIFDDADIGVVCFAPHSVLEANSANKFYDYHAVGLPVVTNYEGWQKVVMQSNETGLSSPQGDTDAFAANIARLAEDPELRTKMGKNGRILAEKEFDRSKIAAELLELFQKVLSQTT